MESKLDTEDFRSLEELWRWIRAARTFVERNLPFWEMAPADAKVVGADDAQCFALDGLAYAIYYPVAVRTGQLALGRATGRFQKQWFNPRTGLFEGEPAEFTADGTHVIGPPPRDPDQDWALLVRSLDRQAGGVRAPDVRR
jgi:hypothetical protein